MRKFLQAMSLTQSQTLCPCCYVGAGSVKLYSGGQILILGLTFLFDRFTEDGNWN